MSEKDRLPAQVQAALDQLNTVASRDTHDFAKDSRQNSLKRDT